MSEGKYNPDFIKQMNEIKKEKPITVTEYVDLFDDELTIEPKRPNGKRLYYLKNGDEIISRSFRKSKLEALIYAINEGILDIDDVKHHKYIECEISNIEKEMM